MSEFPVVPTSNYVNMHNHRSYHLPRCTLTWIPQAVHSHGFPSCTPTVCFSGTLISESPISHSTK